MAAGAITKVTLFCFLVLPQHPSNHKRRYREPANTISKLLIEYSENMESYPSNFPRSYIGKSDFSSVVQFFRGIERG